MSATTASASATFSNHPISSTYQGVGQATTAGGSLWYIEADPTSPYQSIDIGNMTTSGTITNYNIRTLSGDSYLTMIESVATGPDGNVWFDGMNGGNTIAGVLNISTGAATIYTPPDTPSEVPGPIVAGSDGNLYYYSRAGTSSDETYLFYINPTTGVTSVGHTFDTYTDLTSLAAGSDGKLWVTDYFYKEVQSVPTGSSGYGRGGYALPTGDTLPYNIAAGPDSNLWLTVTDGSSKEILKLTTGGTFTSYATTSGSNPAHLTAGPDGAVWFLDGTKIGRISSAGSITKYTIPGTSISGVVGLTVGPDNATWFGYRDSGGWKLGNLVVTPDFTSYSITSASRNPGKMTTAGGSLWYVESTNTSPSVYDHIGSMTISGTSSDYNIAHPSGAGITSFQIADITTGPDGNVWFDGCTNTDATYAGSLNVSTGTVAFYQNTPLPSCYGVSTLGPITAGSDGNLWYVVSDYPTNNQSYLSYVNPSTGATTTGETYDTYTDLTSLTSGPDGNLWATDEYYNRIYDIRISGSGGGTWSIPTSSSGATNITSGPDGNLWFVEGYTHKIVKVTTSGTFTEYPLAAGVYPEALAPGPDGAVWFTDAGGKIGRITVSGGITEYAAPTTTSQNIVLGPDDAVWFDYSSGSNGYLVRLGY